MRRTLAAVLLTLGAVVLPSVAAGPAQPQITLPSSFEVVIPFPDICAFPITITAVVRGRTLSITFLDATGTAVRGFAGGQLFVTYTRDDTGFSRTFAIAGPTFFDASGVAIRGTGRWTTPMVDVGWVLANGNLTFDGTQDGFSLISTVNGNSVPLCDLLS
ncbi:MAG: hypothetical protein M3P43_14135 [Actinomycetota bacterium]|nr:hypothetical protein [Actinomycetota bacterium]